MDEFEYEGPHVSEQELLDLKEQLHESVMTRIPNFDLADTIHQMYERIETNLLYNKRFKTKFELVKNNQELIDIGKRINEHYAGISDLKKVIHTNKNHNETVKQMYETGIELRRELTAKTDELMPEIKVSSEEVWENLTYELSGVDLYEQFCKQFDVEDETPQMEQISNRDYMTRESDALKYLSEYKSAFDDKSDILNMVSKYSDFENNIKEEEDDD